MSPRLSIAHYKIVSKLGEGGMGEVWRATDRGTRRLRASGIRDRDRPKLEIKHSV